MVNDFIAKEDLSLFTSGTRLALAPVFFEANLQATQATFDLYVRELPPTRSYFLFAGLEHVVDFLRNFHFTDSQLAWMKKSFKLGKREMDYFKSFRFTGDIWAMPEGTVFFPGETIIRVSAPIIEAQIIEPYLINAVYLQTILASKIARFARSAAGKEVIIGYNRSYGTDAAMKSCRIAEMLDVGTGISVYHFKRQSHVFSASTYHYVIKAFDNERDAFRAYLKRMRGQGFVLVDTYDTIQGIKNFIVVAKEMEKQGIKPVGIQLDSGDLYKLSVQARAMLDKAGLGYAKIFAMSNLDEFKVAALEKRKAPIDVYAGITGILTPADAPTMELVYKLSEMRKGKHIVPKMKTALRKVSLPGRKQVYRVSENGQYHHDIIGLENERVPNSKKLLVPIFKNGKVVRPSPDIKAIGAYYRQEQKKFNPNLFNVNRRFRYPVKISQPLQELAKKTRQDIRKHYIS